MGGYLPIIQELQPRVRGCPQDVPTQATSVHTLALLLGLWKGS